MTDIPSQAREAGNRQLAAACLLVFAVWLALFLVRLAGPDDLGTDDQERPAAYAVDMRNRGHWIVSDDVGGDIASKPPLHTWLAATAAMALGPVRLAWLLPGAFGTLLAALALLALGRHLGGHRVGTTAAFLWLCSSAGLHVTGLIRTDGVFTGVLALAAGAVVVAASGGDRRWWLLAGLAAGAAMLTKGPFGLWLAFCPLAAWPFARRPVPWWPGPAVAVAVAMALFSAWFGLAWLERGEQLVDKLLARELVGHAIASDHAEPPLIGAWRAPLYLLARGAPATLIVVWALWRRRRGQRLLPAAPATEALLWAWLAAGLFPFMVAGHQRNVLVVPLVVPTALLAALALAPWLERASVRSRSLAACALVVASLTWGTVNFLFVRAADPFVRASVIVADFAHQLEREHGAGFPWSFALVPSALQIHLGRASRPLPEQRARELLTEAPSCALVVQDRSPFADLLATGAATSAQRHASLEVLVNRPLAEGIERVATALVEATVRGGRITAFTDGALVVTAAPGAVLELVNRGQRPWFLRIGPQRLVVPPQATLTTSLSASGWIGIQDGAKARQGVNSRS